MHILRTTLKATCIAAILGAAVIVPAKSVNAGERTLKAKEVRALFPGRYEARVHGYKLAVVASGNGSLAGAAFNRTDKGRWWIKGNRLCVAWSNWTDGKPTCGRITRSGKWYVSHNASGSAMKFKRN